MTPHHVDGWSTVGEVLRALSRGENWPIVVDVEIHELTEAEVSERLDRVAPTPRTPKRSDEPDVPEGGASR